MRYVLGETLQEYQEEIMEKDRPSVFLATSPRMKRSVSSSAGMFNGCAEIFFSVKITILF